MFSVMYNKPVLVQIFLARGAHVTPQNPEGKTALHFAAESGFSSIMNLLLQGSTHAGPAPPESLYITDNKGFTPLHYAAYSDHDNVAERLAR
jgi:ankyrin repeat protein